MNRDSRTQTPCSQETRRARRLYAVSIGAILVMLVSLGIMSREPDKRSPYHTFQAVMQALRTHDREALQRLTSPQGYQILTAHMPDDSAASYLKLFHTIKNIEASRGGNSSFLPKHESVMTPWTGIILTGSCGPTDLKLYFRQGLRGWVLHNLRGYELEPLIRKENGVPVLPADTDVQIRLFDLQRPKMLSDGQ